MDHGPWTKTEQRDRERPKVRVKSLNLSMLQRPGIRTLVMINTDLLERVFVRSSLDFMKCGHCSEVM